MCERGRENANDSTGLEQSLNYVQKVSVINEQLEHPLRQGLDWQSQIQGGSQTLHEGYWLGFWKVLGFWLVINLSHRS